MEYFDNLITQYKELKRNHVVVVVAVLVVVVAVVVVWWWSWCGDGSGKRIINRKDTAL
jgi:multidrug resistance efflux pump